MRQPVAVQSLARRFVAWQSQARTVHRLLRDLDEQAQVIDTSDQVPDGTVTLRVPVALWRAACDEAAAPPPEPLPEPETP